MVSSHFKIGAKLGEGNYGQVYKGTLSVDIAMTPAKTYIARQTLNGKPPYTVAIKLLKGVQHTYNMQCIYIHMLYAHMDTHTHTQTNPPTQAHPPTHAQSHTVTHLH